MPAVPSYEVPKNWFGKHSCRHELCLAPVLTSRLDIDVLSHNYAKYAETHSCHRSPSDSHRNSASPDVNP
jgi:hypothetical protein